MEFTLMTVIHSFLFANSVFCTTDFDNDGEPDDIGFYIKYLYVLNSTGTHGKYFRHETCHGAEPRMYLDMFSQHNLTNKVCVAVLITTQPFKHNKISISYWVSRRKFHDVDLDGGACKKNQRNAAVVSHYIDFGDYIPTYVADLALIHELGHALGAPHDPEKCWGHVMYAKTQYHGSKRYFTFSNCSKTDMLQYIREETQCFEDWIEDSHCGNGLIEIGEECDCGLSYDCGEHDYCCVPHDGKESPCHIDRKSGFDCIPSHGFCCSKECQFLDLSMYQINCRNEDKKCPCSDKSSFCTCGHSGICVGDYCHSRECVYSGLLECVCAITKTLYCETCCLTPEGICRPLSEITEIYVNESNPLLVNLQNVEYIPYQTLGHRIWQSEEICVSFGKTGYCQRGVCDLYAPKAIFSIVERMANDYNEQSLNKGQTEEVETLEETSELPQARNLQFLQDSDLAITQQPHKIIFFYYICILIFIL